jgi:CRP-like cAMP-binding protein
VNAPGVVGPYERLILLKALSLSSHPPVDAIGALAGQAAECHFAAGTSMPTAVGPWEEAHVVVEGRVNVLQDGRQLYTAVPKQAFGLLETLAHVGTDIVQARAEIETVTLQIRMATLFSILEDHQAMMLGAVRSLARLLLTTPAWLAGVVARRAPVSGVALTEHVDLVDRIRRLQMSDVFAHARVDSLAELASQYEGFEAAAGTVLWREGDPARWLLALTGGQIQSASTADLSLTWTAGTHPGLFDALAGVRWHDAVAVTPVTGFRLSADRLFDALEDDFAMAADVLAALAALVRSQRQAPTFSSDAQPPAPDRAV